MAPVSAHRWTRTASLIIVIDMEWLGWLPPRPVIQLRQAVGKSSRATAPREGPGTSAKCPPS